MDRQFSNFKAVEILQMMDAEERALAKAYIHQFTARKQIRDLYDIIEKKLNLLYIDKKQVIKVLKLETSTASDLMNKLHAELRTFIERHLHHHREFSLSQVQNAFHFYAQKQAIHYVSDLVETHDMERRADVAVYPLEHLDWYLLMKSKEVFERNTTHRPAELQPIQYVKNLDVFYWGERILAAIEDINRHAIYNIPYDNQNVQEIINYIEKNLSDQDLLCMYAWIGKLLALSYPFDQGTYNKYIAIIEKLPENEYAEETIRSITYLLSNILNRNRAVLGEDFPRLYIELVEIMAHRGVLILEEKYIQLSIFKNVIQLALYDGRLEWADAFFKRYKSYLPGEASRLFIEACILIEHMDVKESHKLLAKIEKSSDDIYILLDTKILWLQNYLIDYTEKLDYELGFLHAYAKKIVYFIEQHDVNQAARQRAKKWVEYVVQLMKCNNGAAFDKLLLKLEEDVDFLKRRWLKRIVEMRMELLRKGGKKR